MAVAAALLLWVLAARRLERRYDSLRDEVGALYSSNYAKDKVSGNDTA